MLGRAPDAVCRRPSGGTNQHAIFRCSRKKPFAKACGEAAKHGEFVGRREVELPKMHVDMAGQRQCGIAGAEDHS